MLADDLHEIETDIKAVLDKARRAHRRVMDETEDGCHKSALALVELCNRSLAQADDAARYARQNLGRNEGPTQ